MKVTATPSALDLIEDLKKDHGKELLFHQLVDVVMEVRPCAIQ
jgi:uncharacterized protein (DUF779 family)